MTRVARRRRPWRWLAVPLLLAAVLAAALLAAAAWWLQRPLPLAQPVVALTVERGMTPRAIAQGWVDAGVQTSPWLLWQWFRWSGDAPRIRAGSYEVQSGETPRRLLARMVAGDEVLEALTLVEGWTFRQFRAALAQAPHLRQTITAQSDAEVMAALGAAGLPAEGWFFPDTYLYARGSSDLVVLERAHQAMRRHLAAAWDARAPGLPLRTPDEALILASIVEKETGLAADRTLIAGVFVNRLRIGMRLQTDPTVIYGLGEAFDGNLRRIHLQTDGPFNTYTRAGLPPTAIAMPGLASLRAAVDPAPTRALYFVARGDGSSVFSETYAEHDRAVDRYQRSRRRGPPP